MSQFAGKRRFHLVGTSCSPARCSQHGRGGGGGGALPPTSSPQGSSPGSPQPHPPAPRSSPTPASAGRAGETLLIYSTPLEHARDPNGAPEQNRGSGPAREFPGWHPEHPGRCHPCQGHPREHSSAGCQGKRHGHSPNPGSREKPGGPSLEATLEK